MAAKLLADLGRKDRQCKVFAQIHMPIGVFISYAREDAAFVDNLTRALRERGIDAWMDRREIAPAADWLRRIIQGITESTFFIYVLSPESVASKICGVELSQAVALHKPLVPLIRRPAPLPTPLQSIQWSDFVDDAAFPQALDGLEASLRRDPEWLAMHARLSAGAAVWDERGRRWFNLLHGRAIAEAERWLAEKDGTRRRVTELQERYITSSRRFSTHWRRAALGIAAILLAAVGALTYMERRGVRANDARALAARAVQLRNSDQAALAESTLMLISSARTLASLGLRSPEVEAALRDGSRLLLPVLGQGRHPYGVGGMAVSPGGHMIATYAYSRTGSVSAQWKGGVDTAARLWDVPSSQPFGTLPHKAMVTAAAFADDGRLMTGSLDGALYIWDLGQVRGGKSAPTASAKLDGPIVHIVAAAARAFVASSVGTVCSFDTQTGSRLWCASDPNRNGVILLALSNDGKYVASGGEKGIVTLWGTADGRPIATVAHKSGGEIDALVFSPASNQLASGDTKGEFDVSTVPAGQSQFAVSHRDDVTGAVYSPVGASDAFIATSSKDRSLRVFRQGFSTWRLDEFRFDYALWHVAVNPAGSLVAVARGDGYVDLWNLPEERLAGRLRIATGDVATGLAFLPGDVLVVTDGGEGVRFLSVPASREAWGPPGQGVERISVSANGQVVAADVFGKAQMFSIADEMPQAARVSVPPVGAVAFAPAGRELAIVDDKARLLRVLSVEGDSLREIRSWPVADNIGAVAWHPTEQRIAVAKRDGGSWIYDADTGKTVAQTQTGGMALSFAAGGTWLAMIVPYEGLRLWKWAAESEPIAPADTADAVAAAFAPAESVLFTAHRDRRVRSWSVTEAGGAAVLHEIWATDFCQEDKTLAVSPDGSLVAAACEADGRVRLWSAASGVTVTDLRYPGQVKTVAFSRDAHMLIAGGEKQLRSFVVSGSAVVDEACSRLTRNMSLAEWQRHIGGRCELICPRLPGCQ